MPLSLYYSHNIKILSTTDSQTIEDPSAHVVSVSFSDRSLQGHPVFCVPPHTRITSEREGLTNSREAGRMKQTGTDLAKLSSLMRKQASAGESCFQI